MNIVFGAGCTELDEEDVVGAAVAERDRGAADVVADATGAADGQAEEAAPGWSEPAAGEVADRASDGVEAPPGKCCYVRCGAQVAYQKIPWAVDERCDQEGWKFCAEFYVAKLVDAAWLPC